MASAQDGTFPAEPFLRLIRGLAPRPDLGANRLGLVWALPQAKPKLHTTLGQSCQPCEAKFSFQKTGPHSQEGSQPFVWKKRGLLVLTSSSLPSQPTCGPAPRCLPLPDHFSGHQLPDSTRSPRGVARRSASCAFPCLSLPPSTQTRVLEAHSAQRPRSPSPTGSSNSLACSVAVLP